MIGHLEEPSRHYGRFVLLAKQAAQIVYARAREARKKHRSELRAKRFEVVARIEKLIYQRAVRLKQSLRPFADLPYVRQRNDAQSLGRVRGYHAEQIVQLPHALGNL